MKSIENQINESTENIETVEVDSWNQERSDDELTAFLQRRLGRIGLDSIELA